MINSSRRLCCALLACAPFLASCGGGGAEPVAPLKSSADAPNYARYVPATTQLLLIVRPREALNHPAVLEASQFYSQQMEYVTAQLENEYGLPAENCEIFIYGQLAGDSDNQSSPGFRAYIFDQSLTEQRHKLENLEGIDFERVNQDGFEYWKSLQTNDENKPALRQCLAMPEDNVLIAADEETIRAILVDENNEAWKVRLANMRKSDLITAFIAQPPLREYFLRQRESGNLLALQKLSRFTANIQFLDISFSPSADTDIGIVRCEMASAEQADAFEKPLSEALMTPNMPMAGPFSPGAGGALDANGAVSAELFSNLDVSSEGHYVRVVFPRLDQASADRLKALAEKAHLEAHNAARRAGQFYQLHLIGQAVHRFHDANAVFPPGKSEDAHDTNGRPLLSWRVHLLPQLGQDELYSEFRLNEPWDSEHNKRLLPRVPKIYVLKENLAEGMTDILAPYGENTPLDGGRLAAFSDILDGTSNTAMCFEAAKQYAVPWTKPDDFQFDPHATDSMARFQVPGDDGIKMLWMDASSDMLPGSISAKQVMSIIDFNDGQPKDRNAIR